MSSSTIFLPMPIPTSGRSRVLLESFNGTESGTELPKNSVVKTWLSPSK